MSATTIDPARSRGGGQDWLDERSELVRWALPAILVLAGLNFFWQLGSSSYFIDEAFSVLHSAPALGTILHQVGHTETTPWTYFVFLHGWLKLTGTETEWVTRLPSAVAGIVVVWATYWMAQAFLRRVEALAAAALCALSPLILAYAQETRVYIFLVLALTLSVGATVRAGHAARRRTPLLVLGAASAVVAIWLHYTAVSVLLPLAVWVGLCNTLSARQRIAFIAACVIAFAAVTPLLLQQFGIFPNGGAIKGAIDLNNAVSVIGTPFGTRVGAPVSVRSVAGALVVLWGVLSLVIWRQKRLTERWLLVALGVFGVLGLFVLDLTGKHILITRYTVVTAPFLVTLIAAACFRLPAPVGASLAIAAVAVAIAGTVDDHSTSGFYAPTRPVVAYIRAHERPGDIILSPEIPLTDTPIFYYDIRNLRPKLELLGIHDPRIPMVFRQYKRIWLIVYPREATDASVLSKLRRQLPRQHLRAGEVHLWTTSIPLAVLLATPVSS